jgi:hypothetical protein
MGDPERHSHCNPTNFSSNNAEFGVSLSIMTTLKSSLVVLILSVLSMPLHADRMLDGDTAEKLEIRHSMTGIRDTLIFYSFPDQQAILVLVINNKDETFPVTGKIHLFGESTTEEGLKKWINNQHSDGLFVDIPRPIFTGEIPEGSCKVTSFEQTGTSRNSGPRPVMFKDFEVELSMKEHRVDKKFKLTAFTDTARVHVEKK